MSEWLLYFEEKPKRITQKENGLLDWGSAYNTLAKIYSFPETNLIIWVERYKR